MLYEMLTGVLPFNDPSPTSVALQHITPPPPPPCKINPALPAAVETVLLKALSKDPAARYQTGSELIDALELALNSDETVKASVEASSFWVKNKLLLAVLGGVFLLLIAISGTSALVNDSRLKSPAIAAGTVLEASSSPSPSLVAASTQAVPGLAILSTANPSPAASTLPTLAPPVTAVPPGATSTSANPPLAPAVTALPASPTPKYRDGRHFFLYYNDASFYMLQSGGYGGLIAPAAFERLDDQDNPINRFDGDLWAEYHTATLGGWCMRLEILNAKGYLQPAQCAGHYLATRWPPPDDPSIFWTTRAGSRQFRVLWGKEEVGRCEIAAGVCEVYLP
jgi:hypothetical protein